MIGVKLQPTPRQNIGVNNEKKNYGEQTLDEKEMLISEEDMFKDNYDLDGGEIEYTGNEGCSKEYTYRKTAIVICSKSYEGGHFVAHRDTEKAAGTHAPCKTMVCYLY